MSKIHTVKLPDGATATRTSKSRTYVACAVIVRTKEANDAERAQLEAELAEGRAALAEFPAKSDAEIEAAEKEAAAECRAKYENIERHLPAPDGRIFGPKNPEFEPMWDAAWKAYYADPRHLHDKALREVRYTERQIERIPADGQCCVASWHMSVHQAQKAVSARDASMQAARKLDRMFVETNIAVRETAGKKAGKPKNVTPRRLEGLRVVKAVEEGRDPRSMTHSALTGRVRHDLLAMGLIEEGGTVTIAPTRRVDNPDAEFYWGVRDMQLYKLTDAGRAAIEAAS